MQLLFATTNAGKLREAQQIMFDHDLLLLKDFPQLLEMEVEETGSTFQENAMIKALAYGDASGVLTVAEDAGIVVDALNGEPGVYSARWAPTELERNQKMIIQMAGKPSRSARFVSVLCLYDPTTKEVNFFEGRVEGTIAEQIKGDRGFGYDPVFIPRGYDQTFGELGDDVKNTLSHRKRSIEQLEEFLAAMPQ